MLRYVLALLLGASLLTAAPTPEELAHIAAAAPDEAPAKPARPRRVLVLTRNDGFNHTAIPYGSAAIEALGRKTKAFAVTVTDDLSVLSDAGLKPFDALVFDNGYDFPTTPAQRAALLAFVQGGKGIVGIHAASANFKDWPEGSAIFGATFRTHPWTPTTAWSFRVDAPDHPLTAAFEGDGFHLKDEIYVYTGFRLDNARVLVSLDLDDAATGAVPHTDPYVPITWVRRVGRGRVFFCSLGHEHAVFWTPSYLKHLLAGIQYATGDLPADDSVDLSAPYRLASHAGRSDRRAGLDAIDQQIAAAGTDARLRAAIETRLLAALPGASVEARRDLSEPLSRVGTARAVAVVSPWLTDPEMSHAARRVLQRIASPDAVAALRSALPNVNGRLRAGIISSLGALRDAASTKALVADLASADLDVVTASLSALGRIGSESAASGLRAATVPPGLQALRDDALAACGEQLLAAGRTTAAEAVYVELAGADRPPLTRVTALRGLVASGSQAAGPLAKDLIWGSHVMAAAAAATTLDRLKDAGVVDLAVAQLAALPSPVQAAALTALARRGDVRVVDPAVARLHDADAAVRLAAIRALGWLSAPSAIEPLARLAAASEDADERRAAVEALGRYKGEQAETALLQGARGADVPKRVVLLGVLASRATPAAIVVMLASAADADTAVAGAALAALSKAGGKVEIAAVLAVLDHTTADPVRAAAAQALVSILRRQPDRDVAVQPLVNTLATLSAAGRPALLGVLAELGGASAVAALIAEAKGDDAPARLAALNGLADVLEDLRALPPLLALARQGVPEATHGYLRLLGIQAATDPIAAAASLTAAGDLLTTPDLRRQRIVVLRDCRVPAALTLAAAALDDPALLNDATLTIRQLTSPQTVGGKALPAVTGPAADAALDRLAALKDANLPKPWRSGDIGKVRTTGTAACDNGRWTLTAAGSDYYGGADGGSMVYQRVRGDVTVTAHITSLKQTNEWAKAGVMLRASLAADAPNVATVVGAGQCGVFQVRERPGAETLVDLNAAVKLPAWVRIERHGSTIRSSFSADGKAWTLFKERELALPEELLVGVAVSSHDEGAVTEAAIESAVVSQP